MNQPVQGLDPGQGAGGLVPVASSDSLVTLVGELGRELCGHAQDRFHV